MNQLLEPTAPAIESTDQVQRAARHAEDRALALACQGGETSAFDALVARYDRKVYWIAYSLVGHAEDARDLAQETFLRVHRSMHTYDPKYTFYTWVYRIVVNLSIDHLRKRSKRDMVSLDEFPVDPAGDMPPDRDARNAELRQQIERVLGDLPAKYKAVIVLRDVHELPCEEIAAVVGCTNATTRWRLHKARELFRDRWTALYGPVP